MNKGTFTTRQPIYYPSDKQHIGHTYCTWPPYAIARYKRMCGYDVMFRQARTTWAEDRGKGESRRRDAQRVCGRDREGENGIRALGST
jgi:hypothetical protein